MQAMNRHKDYPTRTTMQRFNATTRISKELTTGEYITTDITLAATLLDRGVELVGVESSNASKRRARWVFDDQDGGATRWANEYYNHPEDVTISISALRQGTKLLLRVADTLG